MKFSNNTGIRKLMRASAQGRIPDERLAILQIAEKRSNERWFVYQNQRHRFKHMV